MKIAVCEDNKEELDWLCQTIHGWCLENKVSAEIIPFADAASFSFLLSDVVFDALFLDIKMPGEDGLALAKRLRKEAYDMSIVFVTGEKEYMMEGYEVEAVNYLLKPVEVDKVFQCLERIYQKYHKQEPFVVLKTGETTVKLLQREIYMVEVFGHTLVYTTEKGTFEVISSMKEAKQELQENLFVICHRGVLINLMYVESIGKNSLILSDDKKDFEKEVPVSRRLYGDVNEAFISLYRKQGDVL